MDHNKHTPLSTSRWLTPLGLAVATLITYFPTRHYPFHFDDLANITQNFNIRTFNVWAKMLSYRRWFGEWLNALIFQLDGFAPQYYRLCNIGLHIIGGMLVFYLISWLCARTAQDSITYTQRYAITGITTALFLLHPVQTQTVSYAIQGKLEGAMSVLMLASLACMLPVLTKKSWITQSIGMLGGLTCAFIACGTKEVAIVLPALLLLIDWFFIAQQEWHSLQSRLGLHLVYGAAITLLMLHYFKPTFFINVFSLNSALANNRGNILTANAMQDITPLAYCISEFKVLLHYLWMFIWPFNLSVEYDWKLASHLFAPDAILPLLVLIGMGWYVMRATIRATHPYLTFGVLWFFVVMAPRTTIIPSQELICDYKTYLASVGWLFILAVGIVYTLDLIHRLYLHTRPAPLAYYSFLGIATLGLAGGTYQRNQIWSSNRAFWYDVVCKAPAKARGHNNYGVELVKQGNHLLKEGDQMGAHQLYAQGIRSYEHAIALDNWYADPYANLGMCYTILKDDDKAVEVLQRAIAMFPEYPEAYNNLGTQLLNKKEFAQAEDAFKKAISYRPHYGQAHYNLARTYLSQGRGEDGWQELKRASELDFDQTAGCWLALGQTSMKLAKYDEAVKAFEKAGEVDTTPNEKRLHLQLSGLAAAYYLTNQPDKAIPLYTQLTQLLPGSTGHHHNLAECYFSTGKFEQAIPHYQHAMQCHGCSHKSYLRLAACYEQQNNFDGASDLLHKIMGAQADMPQDIKTTCQNELMRINTKALLHKQQV